jgi:hypothetical protein
VFDHGCEQSKQNLKQLFGPFRWLPQVHRRRFTCGWRPKNKSLAHYNNIATGLRCYHTASMEAYQWFLLGIMAALIPCLVVFALMVRRATRHRELGANPSAAVAVDRAADLRRQAEILTRISKTISNVDSVAALLRLAAEYQALADEHERSIQKQQQIQPKAPDKK